MASYTKHTWEDGELITATKMDNIEEGIVKAFIQIRSQSGETVDFNDYEILPGYLYPSLQWRTRSPYTHICIPVNSQAYRITITTAENATYFGFLKEYPSNVADDGDISTYYSTEESDRIRILANKTITKDVPDDCKYIIINMHGATGTSCVPDSIIIEGDITTRINNLETEVDGMMEQVEQNIFEGFSHIITWESGTYSLTKGNSPSKSAQVKRQRSASILNFPGGATIKINEQYAIRAGLCDANEKVQTILNYTNSDISIPPNTPFVLIIERGDGSADISDMTSEQINALVTVTSDRIANLINTDINWCAMGDSITQGYISYIRDEDQSMNDPETDPTATAHVDKANCWVTKVANQNNWNVTNLGVGGTGFLDPKNKPESMSQEDYTEEYKQRGYYVARNTDFTPFNLVTLAYGINDWKANHEMGSIDDPIEDGAGNFITPTKVIPAMRATIEAILCSTREEGETGVPNPACKVIVILPLNCLGYKSKTAPYARTYANSEGYALGYEYSNSGTLESFVKKMIEVCDYYGIQYIDQTHYSAINLLNIHSLLLDGVHPSIQGHNLLAEELSKKILSSGSVETTSINHTLNDNKQTTEALIENINGTSGWPVPVERGLIAFNRTWTDTTNIYTATYHVCIPIKPTDYIAVRANSTNEAYIALLTNKTVVIGGSVALCANTACIQIEAGDTYVFDGEDIEHTIPQDAKYLYIADSATLEGAEMQVFAPDSVTINWVQMHYNVRAKIDELESNISSQATETQTIDNKINTLKNIVIPPILNNIAEITGNEVYTFKQGYYTTPASGSTVEYKDNNGYVCAYFPVTEGEVITYNVTGTTGTSRSRVFIDVSGNAIDRVASSESGEKTVIVPANAVYMAINNKLASQADGYYVYKGKTPLTTITELEENINGTNGWSLPWRQGFISISTTKWLSTPINSYHVCYPISANDGIVIKTGETNTYIAFLTNDIMAPGQLPSYCADESLITFAPNMTYILNTQFNTLPATAKYLYISCQQYDTPTPNNYEPISVVINGIEQRYNIRAKIDALAQELSSKTLDSTLTQTGKAADAKAVGDALTTRMAVTDIDNTLTLSGKPADAKVTGDNIKNITMNIQPYNSYDVLAKATHQSTTMNGVTYTWNADNTICTCNSNGSAATGGAYSYFWNDSTSLPEWLEINKKYRLKVTKTGTITPSGKLHVYVEFYKSNGSSLGYAEYGANGSSDLIVPSNAVGCAFAIRTLSGTVVNATISVQLLTGDTNAELTESIDIIAEDLTAIEEATENSIDTLTENINGTSGWPVPLETGIISSGNTWIDYSGLYLTTYHVCIPIKPTDYIAIHAQSGEDNYAYIALLTDKTKVLNARPAYCDGTSLIQIDPGETYVFDGEEHVLPSDVKYLYIADSASLEGGEMKIFAPTSVTINWVQMRYNVRQKIDSMDSDIDSIEEQVVTLNNKVPTVTSDFSAGGYQLTSVVKSKPGGAGKIITYQWNPIIVPEYTGSDGYYILQAYKANGNVTYSWIPKP